MNGKGQQWTAAHAAENMAVELAYSEQLEQLRNERKDKVRACNSLIHAAKQDCEAGIAAVKLDIEKRRLEVRRNIDTLHDRRTLLRQHMHDRREANNADNEATLLRLSSDIDEFRHMLLSLDEERQQRTAQCKAIFEGKRHGLQQQIGRANAEFSRRARELREQLMATYKANREKAEQQRQEGGEQ